MSAILRVVWMLFASSRVSAFEFSMMYTSRLYFEGWVPCEVCVCMGLWRFLGHSWCVGCGLDMGCVSSPGE